MKMEVLSVQNQFQGQFGVIGSTKVKDWTSPLTPPPSHHHHNHYSSSNTKQSSIDIVDGHQYHNLNTTMSSPTAMHHHHHHHHHHLNHHHHHHLQATTKSRTNRQTTNYSDNNINSSSNIKNATNLSNNNSTTTNNSTTITTTTTNNTTMSSGSQIEIAASATPAAAAMAMAIGNATPTTNNHYNSNLICMTSDDDASVNALSIRLQSELRAAKSRHLACTEVSLPWDLTPRIAAEIIKVSEKEPCGIRGCTIYIEFEDEPSNTRRIASMRVDPNTVPTFELYLTLKQDKSGWTSLLPQFIKNLTKSSTILISPDFSLTKNKLYHSSSE